MAKYILYNVEGNWVVPKAMHINDAGTWKPVKNAYVYSGGAWQQFWPTPSATISLSSGAFTFDPVTWGSTTLTRTLTITNTGSIPMKITSIEYPNLGAGATINASPNLNGTTVAAGASVTLKLSISSSGTYRPGIISGSLKINAVSVQTYNVSTGSIPTGRGYGNTGGYVTGGFSAGASAGGGGCCFIVLEARYGTGTIDRVIRKYRDEHITERNQRGYYKLAEVFVPLMRESRLFKALVILTFVGPAVSYAKWYYGENRWGWIFTPLKKFWMKVFDTVGGDTKFIRENGEEI